MIQCALRTKIEHIYAYSALGTDALFLYHDICGVALKRENGGIVDFEITVNVAQLNRLANYIVTA